MISTKRKLTVGTVVQTFDENNKCIEQEFIAGDEVYYEDADGNTINEWNEYQPFDMVQPGSNAVALVGNISDGFRAVGPFTYLKEACRWAYGQESWVFTMQNPYEEFDNPKV